MRPCLDAERGIQCDCRRELRLEGIDSFRNFLWMEPAKFDEQTNVSQAEHLVSANIWTWTKNHSSAVFTGYLNAVGMPHHRSRYATVRIKHSIIAAAASWHRIVRRTFVMQKP